MSVPTAEIDREERADAGNGARPLALGSAIASLAGVVATVVWAERWNAITITLVVVVLWAAAVAAVDALVVLRRYGRVPTAGRTRVGHLPHAARGRTARHRAHEPRARRGRRPGHRGRDAAPRSARRSGQPRHPRGRRADDGRSHARCGGARLHRSHACDLRERLSARSGVPTRGRAPHRGCRLGGRKRAHVQHRPVRARRPRSALGPRAARRRAISA